MKKQLFLGIIFLFFCFTQPGWAMDKYLQQFEDRVTEFSLANNLKFIVIERHKAPVASFVTLVKAGGVNEPSGETGLAHLLEHMAFKGTKDIGTRNWEKEKELLERLDVLYKEIRKLKEKPGIERDQLEKKISRFKELQEKAKELSKANEFARIIEQNGGTHLNAGTSADYTIYYCSLPANRAELWFSLESDRLKNPVWREFYTEKSVVLEERRMRVESDPTGRLMERLVAISYLAHPYGRPVIGWHSDIESLTKKDLQDFYAEYYRPGNMIMVVAGDVQPEQVKKWAKIYFGSLRQEHPLIKGITEEPEQLGKREIIIKEDNPSVYARAYHSVEADHPDAPKLDLLADIMSRGRTSRLYSQLVVDKKLANRIFAFNGYPGERYPSLFIIFAVPNQGVNLKDLASGLDKELNKIKQGSIEQEELTRAITKIRTDLIRSMDSNLGLAKSLAKAELLRGDWRKVFTYLDKLEQVTLEDLKGVAKEYLTEDKSNVGKLIQTKKTEQGQ